MLRPTLDEYNPYFKHYIDLVPAGELNTLLLENEENILAFFKGIPSELQDHRYAANKWSVKEVLGHIIDSERTFAYRALVCLRMDGQVELPSMDENLYAENRNVTAQQMEELIEEFRIVRAGTLALYKHATEKELSFRANSKGGKITALALGFIIIGHCIHHQQVLIERYLSN